MRRATNNRAAANDRLLSSDIFTVLITAQKWSKKYSARNVRRVEIVMSNERGGEGRSGQINDDGFGCDNSSSPPSKCTINVSDGQLDTDIRKTCELAPAVRGSQEAGFTQPSLKLFLHFCICSDNHRGS